MSYHMTLEMVRVHTHRAAILLKRADRTMIASVRARIVAQATGEQAAAAFWTAQSRVYRPLPMKVTA